MPRLNKENSNDEKVQNWVGQKPLPPSPPKLTLEGIPSLASFDQNVEQFKNISVDEFKTMFAPEKNAKYLEKIDFDPTMAEYFKLFANPKERPPNNHYQNNADYNLTAEELELFKKNGFVATEMKDRSPKTFAREYYRLFNNDLPVFITTDSILHAFHMSYDTILKRLEAHFFMPTLQEILKGMSQQLESVCNSLNKDGPLYQSCQDADVVLAVARTLLATERVHYLSQPRDEPPKKEEKSSFWSFGRKPKSQATEEDHDLQVKTVFGNDDQVEKLLRACFDQKSLKVVLFGRDRDIDFTHLKPRGHYAKQEDLRCYFRAMMWLGRVDMKIAGDESTPREMGAAVVLHTLLTKSENGEQLWNSFNTLLEGLVGSPNSMTFTQLGLVLNEAVKFKSYTEMDSEEALVKAQQAVLASKWGIKQYNAEATYSMGPGKKELARSFTIMGQRFSLDSWAMAKVVHDQVYWNGNKVIRKYASALDVAFSVFGNDSTVPLLAERISDQKPKENFRDGLPYQPNLVALRKTLDDFPAENWKASLYTYWLDTLRTLSEPTLDAKYPQFMRTKAYAMKNLNTQLANWSQLRHDNLLYVEEPQSFLCGCSYPTGFVEPRPKVWQAIGTMALVAGNIIHNTPFPKDKPEQSQWYQPSYIKKEMVKFFENFAKVSQALCDISEKELKQEPLDKNETLFLKTTMEGAGFMSGMSMWSGWYCHLYYSLGDADDDEPIVCDVFTNQADPNIGDPGNIVHEGLGIPKVMLVAVDSGKDRTVYSGPIFTHYEFNTPNGVRWSDKEWEKKLETPERPPLPSWTRDFVVAK